MYNYFVNNISVEETIHNAMDILDFCLSQKTGKDFVLEYRTNDEIVPLQKTNRYFVSNSGGTLVKVNGKTGNEIGLNVGKLSKILNDHDSLIDIKDYDINYEYYIDEAQKYINDIEKNTEFLEQQTEIECEDEEEDVIFDNLDTSSIKIVPSKFRYSSYAYTYDKDNNCIWRGIGSVKYITKNVTDDLDKLSENEYDDFIDFLIDIEENSSINSRQLEILIRLDYFSEFGNNKKLINIYNEFKSGVNKYRKTLKEETKDKRIMFLKHAEINFPNEKIGIEEQIKFDKEIFGNIQTIYPIDKNIIFITNVDTIYTPKVTCYCFYNGNYGSFKVKKAVFAKQPFEKNSILYWKRHSCEPAVLPGNNGDWIPTGKMQVWLDSYEKISYKDVDKMIAKL